MSEGLTARETLLGFLAIGITLLLAMSISALYRHEYSAGFVCLGMAAGLSYLFFRRRKVLLTIWSLTFVFINVGLHNMFHPSLPGYLVTYGSVGGLLLLVWWRARARLRLGIRAGPGGMHKLFDKDHGDEL